MTAAEVLVACRTQRGLTQEQLALKVGVAHQRISEWERGIKEPGYANVERILTALGYDLQTGDAR